MPRQKVHALPAERIIALARALIQQIKELQKLIQENPSNSIAYDHLRRALVMCFIELGELFSFFRESDLANIDQRLISRKYATLRSKLIHNYPYERYKTKDSESYYQNMDALLNTTLDSVINMLSNIQVAAEAQKKEGSSTDCKRPDRAPDLKPFNREKLKFALECTVQEIDSLFRMLERENVTDLATIFSDQYDRQSLNQLFHALLKKNWYYPYIIKNYFLNIYQFFVDVNRLLSQNKELYNGLLTTEYYEKISLPLRYHFDKMNDYRNGALWKNRQEWR